MNHQYCVGDFFLPGWLGESLNLLNTVSSPLQAEPVLTIMLPFLGRFGGKAACQQRRSKGEREWWSLWNKRRPEGQCMAHLCWCWW